MVIVAMSGGIVSAWGDIPGVTRPYDPGKYYSQTEISYPDSTYTPFTMRDLASNGYKVEDVTREKKSGIASIKTYIEMFNSITNLTNKALNITGLSNFSAAGGIQQSMAAIENNNMSSSIPDINTQELFRNTENANNPEKSFDKKSQLIWQSEYYQKILAAANDSNADNNIQNAALISSLGDSNNADGEVAALQADNEVQAVNAMAISRRSTLLANYAALEAANSMAERDEALKSAQLNQDGLAFRVPDPYHLSESDAVAYTPPESPGMPDF